MISISIEYPLLPDRRRHANTHTRARAPFVTACGFTMAHVQLENVAVDTAEGSRDDASPNTAFNHCNKARIENHADSGV